ncbi:ABC transporter permease [Sphingomonas antarctica]|uniref:hypothetical protein n=1 Tax=Sphingomonas antarctica TaxID=2040274 RepID=UPI0039E7636E
MSALAVGQSSLTTTLKRYARSHGLWLMLLVGPIGARFMIARDDGSGVQIAIGNHLPVMTSAMLGISLGIVVSTLLLPIGFIYLRANVTRRQPWQIEEVTPARRIPIALGRFGADVAVLFGMLSTLTLAGWLLGWLIVTGPYDPLLLTACLWLVAGPSVMGLAAFRALLDAFPATRRWLGEPLFFIAWMASIAMPAAVSGERSSFASNMYDFAGFVRPLVGPAPSIGNDFSIGSTTGILPGRVPLDVLAGIGAPGYLASRFAWAAIAVAVAILAGLLYRPHTARLQQRSVGRIARLFAAGPPPLAVEGAPSAAPVAAPFIGLVAAEFRLIGGGRLFHLLAAASAIAGVFGDFRHVGSAASLLLLIFGLSAHAGRSEASGLLALTRTTQMSPAIRRSAFLVAGLGWAILLALPATALRLSPQPLVLMIGTTGAAAMLAIGLAAISRSAFAPRLVLLILWYGYLSS